MLPTATEARRPGPPAVAPQSQTPAATPAPNAGPAAAAAAPQGGGQQPGVPPQLAGVPPQYLQRMQTMTGQDAQALATIPVPALAALKKLVPELGQVWDLAAKQQGGGAAAAAGGQPGGAPQQQPGSPPPPNNGGANVGDDNPSIAQPKSRLAEMT